VQNLVELTVFIFYYDIGDLLHDYGTNPFIHNNSRFTSTLKLFIVI